MKSFILTMGFILAFGFGIFAQQDGKVNQKVQQKKQTEQKVVDPNAPDIEFDKVVHDYGTIQQHGDGNCNFIFKNTGKQPLILSKVKSSCGCTVPRWPKQPILPGTSDTIKVKYDTKRVGPINKSIIVNSNAKTNQVVLKIKGKINVKPAEQIPAKQIDKTGSPVNK